MSPRRHLFRVHGHDGAQFRSTDQSRDLVQETVRLSEDARLLAGDFSPNCERTHRQVVYDIRRPLCDLALHRHSQFSHDEGKPARVAAQQNFLAGGLPVPGTIPYAQQPRRVILRGCRRL
jgi:hypothetical protein